MRCRWWSGVGIAALLLASRSARAEDAAGFLRVAAGASVPLADRRWAETVKVSPTVSAMIGGVHGRYGGGVSADWTLTRLAPGSLLFPVAAENQRLDRVRLLGHGLLVLAESRTTVYLRAGAGVDLAFARYDLLIGTAARTRTKAGLGLEVGAGVWFTPGAGLRIGGELAVPMSHHTTDDVSLRSVGFNYTSIDLQLLVAVRFSSGD